MPAAMCAYARVMGDDTCQLAHDAEGWLGKPVLSVREHVVRTIAASRHCYPEIALETRIREPDRDRLILALRTERIRLAIGRHVR